MIYQGKTREEEGLEIEAARLKLTRKYGSKSTNKLIAGDNLSVLKNFYENKSIKGKVELIYIDPPFWHRPRFCRF